MFRNILDFNILKLCWLNCGQSSLYADSIFVSWLSPQIDNPPITACSAFRTTHGHAEQGRVRVASWARCQLRLKKATPCLLVPALTVNRDLYGATLSTYLCSCMAILLLKMAPRYRAEVLCPVPKHKKVRCRVGKNVMCYGSFTMELLAMSLILTNQQCVLNMVSLKRNAHKIKLCIDQLMTVFWPEALRYLTLYSL